MNKDKIKEIISNAKTDVQYIIGYRTASLGPRPDNIMARLNEIERLLEVADSPDMDGPLMILPEHLIEVTVHRDHPEKAFVHVKGNAKNAAIVPIGFLPVLHDLVDAIIEARFKAGRSSLTGIKDGKGGGYTCASLPIANAWIPVSERLPEDRQKVLAYSHFPDGAWYQNVVIYHKAHGFLNLQQSFVTHWMPLPSPPSQAPTS